MAKLFSCKLVIVLFYGAYAYLNHGTFLKFDNSVLITLLAASKEKNVKQEATQPSDFFRSKLSGAWAIPLTWQSSPDNLNWVDSELFPTSASSGIVIRNGHIVTLNADATAKSLKINAGAVLTNTNVSGGFQLTVENDGTLNPDFEIYGTYVLFGKKPILKNNATVVVYTSGLIRADDNIGGGSVAFASSSEVLFKTGAVFEWNNNNAFSTSGITYFLNSTLSDVPIFRISKIASPVGSAGITTFNGILEVNANCTFYGNGLKTFRDGITGMSTLILNPSGSGYNITSPSAILGGNLQLILNENLRLANGLTIPSNANVKVSTTNSGKFLRMGTEGGSFRVNGILDVSDVNITNTYGDVTINGTLKTSRVDGLYNPGIIANGNIYINEGSTIEYNGDGNQEVTSSATLKNQSYYNITFSNSGTKRLKGAAAVHTLGTVTITGPYVIVDASFNLGLLTVNATNFKMDGGRLILSSTGTQPNMGGNYNITGGVVEFANNSGTRQNIRNKSYQNIEVTGTSVGNSSGNITLNPSGTFKVKSGATFLINDNSIIGTNGTESVIVEPGATFQSGNNRGFHGFTAEITNNSSIHSNITNISLLPGSTIEYTRMGDQPITNANGLIYSNLILSGNGNKVAPVDELKIQGNFIKKANLIFLHNNGTVIFNGNQVQNYNSVSAQIVFNNLTNYNTSGLNINDSITVYKQFLLGENSKIILNKDLTLKSDNDNTANVGQIPASAAIIYGTDGRVIVERYIPNHSKAWQLLSAPAKGSTINQSWQEGNVSGMSNNSKPGYGTTITSDRRSWQSDGFDLFSPGGPSMKTWGATTKNWEGVPATNIEIANGNGYMLFVRGDRSVTAFDQAATATVLRIRGKLYAPGLEAPLPVAVPAKGFASIANPYASSINFSALERTNIDDSYYIWDPQLTTYPSAYGLGGYRAITGNSVAPAGGNYPETEPVPFIQSGQAFFVHNSSSDLGFIHFAENSKAGESKSIFRTANYLTPEAQLRGNLHVKQNGNGILIDGTLTKFHRLYADPSFVQNAVKLTNSGENMGISGNGRIYAIESRQLPHENDTLFYHLSQLKAQQYQLEFIATKLNELGIEATLEDNYLKTKTLLNNSGNTRIDFVINNTAESYANNRFHVIFKAAAGPLPVRITNVKAYTQNKNIAIEWKTEDQNGISKFIVEKSGTGNNFISLKERLAGKEGANFYKEIDVFPINGYNFYRIKCIGFNGETHLSEIVKVLFETTEPGISIYPNPVIGNYINLQFQNQPGGIYKASLFNESSQLIFYKEFNHISGSGSEPLIINKAHSKNIFYLEITKPDGEKWIEKIIL